MVQALFDRQRLRPSATRIASGFSRKIIAYEKKKLLLGKKKADMIPRDDE
jgi:hypothetical protein